MTAPAVGDLSWVPVALTGGLQDARSVPGPNDLQQLENWALFRGRFALRAPLTATARLISDTADESPAQSVNAILAIEYHVAKCYVVAYRAGGINKTYLYRLDPDGTPESGETASPIATVWTGASVPRVSLTSFEGGSATGGVQRVYITDTTDQYAARYWDSDGLAISDVKEDFNDDGVKENLYFPLIFTYSDHLFGTDFYQASVLRYGLIRFSQPGLIPADEPGVVNNPSREWWFSEWRQIGSRGDRIVCASDAGASKILYKRRRTYALQGFDASSWALRRVKGGEKLGAVGPHAAAALPSGASLFWSDKGPHLTDGVSIADIGESIRGRVVAATFSSDVAVEFSHDDGLAYVVIPNDSGYPHRYYAWDVASERWVGEGAWYGHLSRPALANAEFVAADSTGLDDTTFDTPPTLGWVFLQGADATFYINSNQAVPASNAVTVLAQTNAAAPGADDLCEIIADVYFPATGTSGHGQVIFRGNGSYASPGYLVIDFRCSGNPADIDIKLGRWYNVVTEAETGGTVTIVGLKATGKIRLGVTLSGGTLQLWTEPFGGGSRTLRGSPWTPTNPLTGNARLGLAGRAAVNQTPSEAWRFEKLTVTSTTSYQGLRLRMLRAIPDDTSVGPQGPPTGVSVATVSDTELDLSWTNGDAAFDVETDIHRSTTSGFTPSGATLIATVASGVVSYSDTGLTASTTYYYKLIHRRGGISSAASDQASGTTDPTPSGGPSGPPTNGSTSLYGNPATKIQLHWMNGDATAYTRIYQDSIAPGNLKGTVDPGVSLWPSGQYISGQPYTWLAVHFKNGIESSGLEITYPET